MKKTLVVATVACACALAASADVGSFFKGITNGSASEKEDLSPSGGAWAFGTGDYTVTSGVVGFDLDDDQAMAFNVSAAAGDTNTVTYVTVTGDFTPVRVADFPTNALMAARSAKVGFLVGVTDAPVTTNYYAWVGATGGASAADWIALSGAAPNGETALVAKFDYRFSTAKVSFGIASGVTTNWLADASSSPSVTNFAFTAGDRQVAGISCYGSGTLSKADGDVELAVATVTDAAGAADGVAKYGTLAEAADAATSGNTITVVRDTDENVALNNGVKIADPEHKTSGKISVPDGSSVTVVPAPGDLNAGASATNLTIALDVAATSVDQVNIDLGDTISQHKEVADESLVGNKITFDLQTKSEILSGVTPNSASLINAANVAELREFIASDTALKAADESASVTIGTLGSALEAEGGNGLAKWKSFVLGVKPTESFAAESAPSGDTSTDSIKLAIPAATNVWAGASKYTVTYKVAVDGGAAAEVAEATSQNITLSNLPTDSSSKRYSVKATLTPAP